MNDIYVWLIVMGIIYILPEVFRQDKKRKGRGKYKYPQFPLPPQLPPENKPHLPPQGETTQQTPRPTVDYSSVGYEYYQPPLKPAQQEVFSFAPPEAAPASAAAALPPAAVTSGASPWQNVLTSQVLANAIVFSEIILPPRAHRPFGSNYGGRIRR